MTVLNECFRRAKELTVAKWQEILGLVRRGKFNRALDHIDHPCGFCHFVCMINEFLGVFSSRHNPITTCGYCPARALCGSGFFDKIWDLDRLGKGSLQEIIKDLEVFLVEISTIQEFKTK